MVDDKKETYGEVKDVGNATNIAWHHSSVTKEDIHKRNNHKSCILWFTGLSGSGKSTLANAVNMRLFQRGMTNDNDESSTANVPLHSYILDGDNIRHGINQDLGFSDEDRVENIRRIGHIAALFLDAGMIVLTAFVSPFRSDREQVRQLVNRNGYQHEFIEVFCDASLDVCEKRDTKGLYDKARKGIIKDFTGISSPYEAPENPELIVNTGETQLDECVDKVVSYLEEKGLIPKVVG
ncbi:adenylylsulfate kinase [Chaetoceros tenuissimus]|uniref:Adenylyl-sulfate kinase n=1 Tax=Chaetoceros tenuissimus TaxID=426638 RepID=A0AAD3HEZ9_9STRA|nr:adenylylsulfate kinase [Chaetoceros tenuissimus]